MELEIDQHLVTRNVTKNVSGGENRLCCGKPVIRKVANQRMLHGTIVKRRLLGNGFIFLVKTFMCEHRVADDIL